MVWLFLGHRTGAHSEDYIKGILEHFTLFLFNQDFIGMIQMQYRHMMATVLLLVWWINLIPEYN